MYKPVLSIMYTLSKNFFCKIYCILCFTDWDPLAVQGRTCMEVRTYTWQYPAMHIPRKFVESPSIKEEDDRTNGTKRHGV